MFRKEQLTEEEVRKLRENYSFKTLLIINSAFAIPIFLALLFLSLFPFFPSSHGLGVQNPSTWKEYFNILGARSLKSFVFTISLIFATTVINFFRIFIDLQSGYKKIGVFQIQSIIDNGPVKMLKLKGGRKIKISIADNLLPASDFDNLCVNELIEIGKTKTNRIIKIEVLHS